MAQGDDHYGEFHSPPTALINIKRDGKLAVAIFDRGHENAYDLSNRGYPSLYITEPAKAAQAVGPFPMPYGQIGSSGATNRRFPRPRR